jgi:hypothetical protein
MSIVDLLKNRKIDLPIVVVEPVNRVYLLFISPIDSQYRSIKAREAFQRTNGVESSKVDIDLCYRNRYNVDWAQLC